MSTLDTVCDDVGGNTGVPVDAEEEVATCDNRDQNKCALYDFDGNTGDGLCDDFGFSGMSVFVPAGSCLVDMEEEARSMTVIMSAALDGTYVFGSAVSAHHTVKK
jgi:hypothetical protein